MRAWFMTAILLAVALAPVFDAPTELGDVSHDVQPSSPLQATVSPSTGWTAGGQEITITGSGFLDLADRNVTDDGQTHQWAQTTADFSDEAGRWNAVAVDSNGHVHVVHIKDTSYQLRHSVYDGTGWSSSAIKNCGKTYCWDVHMVIDSNDELHVAYTTYTSSRETLEYMHHDGTTWTSTEVTPSALFGPVGIAVDSNNHPHISYAANGQYCGNGLRLASHDGTGWSSQGVDLGSNRGCESAILIDGNDHVYIAYQDRSASKLKIATDKNGQWDDYTVNTGSHPSDIYPGYMTSMAMDAQGQFHIAHFEEQDDDLRYSTGAPGGPWTTTIVDASGHTGRDPSIAVDAADRPHIVYHTWTGGNLKYATLDSPSSNWAVSTLASTGDVGEGNAIVIDSSGVMHVPFNDATTGYMEYMSKSTGLSITDEVTIEFGQLGAVTGDVVNDTTVHVTTPSVASAGVVDLTLVDKDGNEHLLSSSFEFIDQNDLDGDGVQNADDDCPNDAGTSTQDLDGCPDDDGDGYSNAGDAFPANANEWEDSDGDGVGNNADAFPNDPTETFDSDGDGVGDNSDQFPFNAFETFDSDGDGVGDNGDAFPNDASESADTDGDGVGDNADAFPTNAFEQYDSDGDGVGDNTDAFPNDASESADSDGDGVGDNADAFPNDASESVDSDGDGIGDNTDAYPNDANESIDSDGDGIGDAADQCPDTESGVTVDANGCVLDGDNDGVPDVNDQCPEVDASDLDENGDGCLDDDDGDGVLNPQDDCPSTEGGAEVSEQGCSEAQLRLLDEDADGVSDFEDVCPSTPPNTIVNAVGCVDVVEEDSEEESTSALASFFAGQNDPVRTTVSIGAVLLALFSLLQTNAVAAMLPETFRWVQVLRRNSKLTEEEREELRYLQSITQAYHHLPQEFADELDQLKADLTGRYTNNEITKETREKLFTLIEDLRGSTPEELYRIAHNEAYFGLAGAIDSEDRTKLLHEKLAMSDEGVNAVSTVAVLPGQAQLVNEPPVSEVGVVKDDGYEWIQYPPGHADWWYRPAHSNDLWQKWQ
ncbi:MAG: thrombospondin type 3 repeat-containing protein [Candidatus Poseidoniaceae archaeon]